jgi:hypothetical protein
MKFNKKKIVIAVLCFVTLGLLSDSLIKGLSVFVVPGLFGLVIPIVNWESLEERRMMKMTFLLLISVVLFYLSFFAVMTIGVNSLAIAAIICGFAGVGEYLISAIFVKSLDKGVIQLMIVFVLGLLSIPTASLLANILKGTNTPSDFLFATWTIQVGFGTSLGQRLV